MYELRTGSLRRNKICNINNGKMNYLLSNCLQMYLLHWNYEPTTKHIQFHIRTKFGIRKSRNRC